MVVMVHIWRRWNIQIIVSQAKIWFTFRHMLFTFDEKKRDVIYTDKLIINQFAFQQGILICYPLHFKKKVTNFSFLSVGFPSVTFI